MNILIAILNTLIQNFTNVGFMLYIAHTNLKKLFNFKFITSFLVYSVILFIIQSYDNHQLVIAIIGLFVMHILLLLINSECRLNTAVCIILFSYFITNLSQFVLVLLFILLKIPFNENNVSDPYLLILFTLNLMFIIIANHFLHFKKLADKFCDFSYVTTLFLIVSIIIYCLFTLMRTGFSLGLLISTGTTIIFFIIIGIFILLQSFHDMKRKQALKNYSAYMPIVNTMIDNIQKRQHLYNNRILSLSQLTNAYDNYDDLCNAINEITKIDNTQKYSYDFLHLENKLLAGLLFSKLSLAENKNLNIIFTICNYSYISKCTDYEIIDITGIIIDNAIEACTAGDTIYISIGNKQNNTDSNKFRITVENPGPVATDEFIKTIFTKRYTTKKDDFGHGLGLSIVNSIVKKYHGYISVFNTTHSETPDTTYLSIEIEL